MQSCYLNQLAPALVQLVQNIEIYSGKEIEVMAHPRAPSVALDHQRAVLYFTDPNSIDRAAAPHELLHIARNWPEQVPMVFTADNDPANAQNIANLDNILEHLVIVPRESNYGVADPFARWNASAASYWGAAKWAQIGDLPGRRMSMLLHWLSVHFLVTDQNIRGLAVAALRTENHFLDALGFSCEIAGTLHDKARMVATTLHYLQCIPPPAVVLRLFDPHLLSPVDTPVPAY